MMSDDGASIDLIISDLKMSGMSGLELLQEVHRVEVQMQRRHTKKILATSYKEEDISEGLNTLRTAGIDVYYFDKL